MSPGIQLVYCFEFAYLVPYAPLLVKTEPESTLLNLWVGSYDTMVSGKLYLTVQLDSSKVLFLLSK
jgi:hypothetical protein